MLKGIHLSQKIICMQQNCRDALLVWRNNDSVRQNAGLQTSLNLCK